MKLFRSSKREWLLAVLISAVAAGATVTGIWVGSLGASDDPSQRTDAAWFDLHEAAVDWANNVVRPVNNDADDLFVPTKAECRRYGNAVARTSTHPAAPDPRYEQAYQRWYQVAAAAARACTAVARAEYSADYGALEKRWAQEFFAARRLAALISEVLPPPPSR